MQTTLPDPLNHAGATDSADAHCPACEQGRLEVFFEVAQAPILCNILCSTREAALAVPRGKISLGFCAACGHVYNVAFDPRLMQYDAAYENSLQFSPRFREYLHALASGLVERYDLRDKDIIEIGCGQGDFLSLLCRMGSNRGLGFDPSFDPRKADTELAGGVSIVPQLYSHEHADRQVDLLCCRHVLEHIPRPLEFLKQLRRTLAQRPDVALFFEVPNALFTLEQMGIWDIIYEHCSYFTPASLRRSFELAGFEVVAINEVYERQFLTIEARVASTAPSSPRETDRLAETVQQFEREYRSRTALWRQRLDNLASRRRRAMIWGAGSKGVTFLNVMNVTTDVVTHAVDLNPRKHGQFIIGTAQPIVPPSFLIDHERPEMIIVMNGIYAGEIRDTARAMNFDAEIAVAG